MKKKKFPLVINKTKSLGGHRIDGCPLRLSDAPLLEGVLWKNEKNQIDF